ncbi:MAG: hypothetical protein ACFB4J_05180 [Elainellaceae cyanobacterium]
MKRRLALGMVAAAIALPVAPGLAHQVTVADNVGGTLHIEPNDVPRAGQETLAWFALARRGGQTIPLSACHCALSVYQSFGAEAIATPRLEAITAEGYRGIPSASFAFPRPGQYELVLTGRPVAESDFQPFTLRFDVTVAR